MSTRNFGFLAAVLALSLALGGSALAAQVPGTGPAATAADDVPDGGTVVGTDSGVLRGAAHHGGATGHLPPSRANLDLVSKLRLSNVVPEWVTDVATYRDTAFLGAWSTRCNAGTPGGFWSVDFATRATRGSSASRRRPPART